MKALLIGATGATGKDLLDILLKDAEVAQIKIFVRRDNGIRHPKLNTHMVDFDRPQDWSDLVQGDVLFSCLGTTLKAAGSKDAQWKVDYGYQYRFAQAARENGVPAFVLVSAQNAAPDSLFFYSKMKGQLEVAIRALAFPKLIIFNPPLLLREHSNRAGEVLAARIIGFLNRLGMLRSLKPLHTKDLAAAMLMAVRELNNGTHAFKAQEIFTFVTRK